MQNKRVLRASWNRAGSSAIAIAIVPVALENSDFFLVKRVDKSYLRSRELANSAVSRKISVIVILVTFSMDGVEN